MSFNRANICYQGQPPVKMKIYSHSNFQQNRIISPITAFLSIIEIVLMLPVLLQSSQHRIPFSNQWGNKSSLTNQ